MQTFFAKCAALAVIVGGFACTGDLGRLAARFTALLEATTVPETEPPPAEGLARSATPAMPAEPATAQHALDAPLGRRVEIPPQPAESPSSLDLASLRPGDRLMLWTGRPGTEGSFIALDLVDPAAGEVLTVQAVPRRMRLVSASAGPVSIHKGSGITLAPVGIVHGAKITGPTETFGPVQGMTVRP